MKDANEMAQAGLVGSLDDADPIRLRCDDDPPPPGEDDGPGSDHATDVVKALAQLDVGSLLPPLFDMLDKPLRRMPTGWPRLDRFLSDTHGVVGGLVRPSFALLGAEPKAGKSTWAQIVAERHACAGGFVYYLDEENGRQRFWRRSLSRRAQLGGARLGDNLVADEHLRRSEAREWAKGMKGRFFYDDTRLVRSSSELRDRVMALAERAGDAGLLVVIDSLQKLPMEMAERRNGIDGWLRQIEALRDDAGAVVLAVSELARPQSNKGYSESRRLKESGGCEYTADMVLILTRDGENDRGDEPQWSRPGSTWKGPTFNLAIDYNRDGATGTVASYRCVFPFHGLEEGALVEQCGRGQQRTSTGGAPRRQADSRRSPEHDPRLPRERDDEPASPQWGVRA